VAAAGCRYGAFFNVHIPRQRGDWHKIDLLLRFVEGIGVPTVTRDMRIVLTERECQWAAAQWTALGLPGDVPVVGVMAGGRGGKRHPLHRLVETVGELHAGGRRVAVFVGPEDRALLDGLRRQLPEGVTVIPPFAVREFAALLARCAVIVTPDSGPMHLAVALGVPTVAVLQSVASLWYRPRGEQHHVLYNERGVPTAAVVEAVETVLARLIETVLAPARRQPASHAARR
jgi:heptosyltransferase-3